jgi:NADH:ubiquinone oxidoreductase subunit 5 (subunit L)/multisubunit Na+/H+ antiporter MnhA subunit
VVSLTLLSLASLSACIGVAEVNQSACLVTLHLHHWFEVGSVSVHWPVSFANPLLCAGVALVSLLVHLVSVVNNASDPAFNLGLGLLSLFALFMLILVTADQLLVLLVGWAAIGSVRLPSLGSGTLA